MHGRAVNDECCTNESIIEKFETGFPDLKNNAFKDGYLFTAITVIKCIHPHEVCLP